MPAATEAQTVLLLISGLGTGDLGVSSTTGPGSTSGGGGAWPNVIEASSAIMRDNSGMAPACALTAFASQTWSATYFPCV